MIGDAAQLAPVHGGAVFNGLIESAQPNEFREEDLSKMGVFSDSVKLSLPSNRLASSMVELSKFIGARILPSPEKLMSYAMPLRKAGLRMRCRSSIQV